VTPECLIDTGAILAILDRKDRWHHACALAFRHLRLPLLTTQAVLTELFHLVGDHRREREAAWALLLSGAIEIAPIRQEELAGIQSLMDRYSDRPMDFADATLVHLARRESISSILTVDLADFNTYRIEGKRRFRVLPAGPNPA
jgi:hypothetical protein